MNKEKELPFEVLEDKLNKLVSEQMKTYKVVSYDVWNTVSEIAFENLRKQL